MAHQERRSEPSSFGRKRACADRALPAEPIAIAFDEATWAPGIETQGHALGVMVHPAQEGATTMSLPPGWAPPRWSATASAGNRYFLISILCAISVPIVVDFAM
jgi:hypothetical protein